MSNKTWLVARREFIENMRTKAFWIGILAVPILIAASVIVPMWLEKAKDVRKYAVIDRSGWLLKAIEDRSKEPDFEKVLKKLFEAQSDPKIAEKDEHVRALLDKLDKDLGSLKAEKELKNEALEGFAKSLTENAELKDSMAKQAGAFYQELGTPEGQSVLAMLPEKAKEAVTRMRSAMVEWWRELPDDLSREYQDQSSRGRYERVEAAGTSDADLEALNKQISEEKLFAYFVINEDPVMNSDGCKYVSRNLTDKDLQNWFESAATGLVQEKRLEKKSIDRVTADWLKARTEFEEKQLSKDGTEKEVGKEDAIKQYAPMAFVYLLWIAIFSITQMLLTNTIEEKSNRILEVLLSSVSPLELMIGKIAGIAVTGLTTIVTWVISFIAIVKFIPMMMGKTSVDLTVIANDPLYLASFILYFLGGYLFFAALFVGIGSVCNSVKEASNLMMPVSILLMVPLFAMMPIVKDPNGSLAKFLSYIPPFTPFVMMNRAAGPPEPWEYAVTGVLLFVSIVLVTWGAAKVFRIGVLMTGKAPTPKEIVRWLKAPVGHVPHRD